MGGADAAPKQPPGACRLPGSGHRRSCPSMPSQSPQAAIYATFIAWTNRDFRSDNRMPDGIGFVDENLISIKSTTISAIRAQRWSLATFGPRSLDAYAAYRPLLARAARAADLTEITAVIAETTALTGIYFLLPDEADSLAF